MSWKKTTIGKHCVVTSSKRFHLSDRSDSGIPFYCSKEIIQKVNGQEVTDCDYIREEAYEVVKEKFGVPKRGDLLITTRGTYGIPYIYKEEDMFYFADGNLTWLKDFDENLTAEFLYYWILSYEGQRKIDAIAKGTAQKAVPIALIKDIELLIPDIETQKKVVSILKSYDALIENNQKQIKLLEEAAQRLYKEWFVDLRFPGYEDTPIVDDVPEGWHKTTIKEVSQVLRRGISPKYNEKAKTMVINQKCIRQTVVSYEEARMQEKAYPPELELQDCDAVICSTGAGTVGRVGQIFGETSDVTIDSHVTLVRAKDGVGKQFLFWTLKEYQNYFMNSGKGSTNQLELSRDTIGTCKVFIPNAKCVEYFEKYTQAIHDRIIVCSEQLKLLKQARDRLLPKLMNGEIEV